MWAHFGTPIVANYDAASRFRFWEDPGYGTPGFFMRFGEALESPFYSSLHSLPDGMYSTFYGDGLCGGAATWANRPPWNFDLMAAGMLLALLPTLAIAVGLAIAAIQLLRQPRASWFLVLGVGTD